MATAGAALPDFGSCLFFNAEVGEHDNGLSVFARVRPRLFGIAYRVLGSVAEAEDIVQDVWMRWQPRNRCTVENPRAFLATTTTRRCINLARSPHVRRETYVGTWLPEPVDTSNDPRSQFLKIARCGTFFRSERSMPSQSPSQFCHSGYKTPMTVKCIGQS